MVGMGKLFRIILFVLSLMTCHEATAGNSFVTVKDGHFERDGKPYYFVGTNFWYGAILASEGQGGDRQRLGRELDAMKALGIDNLRILVGSDGERGVKTKVEPTLQLSPGVYNDTILAGLDYLMMEMGKRNMVAVLYLNNSWEWSGGYGYYLEQAGCGKAPRPNEAGYGPYMNFVSQFATNQRAHELFYDYVRFIIGRTNRYTGRKYVDDPAIMSWQIGNEPRAFSEKNLTAFEQWLSETSTLIRLQDKNHLISVGSEGSWGCENSIACWSRISADPNIDYCNVHLWPYNWGWIDRDSIVANLPRACKNSKQYIDEHLAICRRLQKPLVMEEFGYPRDGMSFLPASPTTGRDGYYRYVMQVLTDSKKAGDAFAGCNFWGWGGYAQPRHVQWQVGDDYCCDPAQEEQGLNSVFLCDSTTLGVIRQAVVLTACGAKTPAEQLHERLVQLLPGGVMVGHQDDPFYGVNWSGITDPQKPQLQRSDVLETCGDYPAVMGFDLGGIEMGDEKNLDSVPFSRIHDELIAHHERGGIVTLSWHPRNPLTGGTAWDTSDNTTVRAILPGGRQHDKLKMWLKRVGDFIATLRTKEGKPVPIIFRPWHENNGSWFWWGAKHCTAEEFRQLWNLMQDTLRERGFDNLLWSYSPNLDGHWTEERFMLRYPGDDRVTLLGEDAYQWGTEKDFVTQATADLDFLSSFAKKHGKLLAMTECGLKNMTDPTWYTRVLQPVIGRYSISYFLLWRNAHEEFFGPVPGQPFADDFNKMVHDKHILLLKDVTSTAEL